MKHLTDPRRYIELTLADGAYVISNLRNYEIPRDMNYTITILKNMSDIIIGKDENSIEANKIKVIPKGNLFYISSVWITLTGQLVWSNICNISFYVDPKCTSLILNEVPIDGANKIQ